MECLICCPLSSECCIITFRRYLEVVVYVYDSAVDNMALYLENRTGALKAWQEVPIEGQYHEICLD